MTDEERRVDLDLDILSYAKRISKTDNECVFYFRTNGKEISSAYGGLSDNIINGLISVMNKYSEAYELISSAVLLFEEDAFAVEEIDTGNVFTQHNIACASIAVMFSEKHEAKFQGWVSNKIGIAAKFDNYECDFSDVIYDLESDQHKSVFWSYMDSNETDYIEYCKDLEESSLYCAGCDTVVHEDRVNWENSQAVCPECGGRLEL